MAILTRQQVTTYASQAGFTGNSLAIAVAIAQAESSFNTLARLVNTDGSIDRGLWQINNRYHPDVSDAQAYDAAGCAQAAYNISSRGTNFKPWVTYNTGAYKKYLMSTTDVSGEGKAVNVANLASLQWVKIPITHGYITNQVAGDWDSPHYAIDMGMPRGTQIGSVINGTVYQADYAVWAGKPGGGEVFIHNDDGGPDWYVYHLDSINVQVGQHVQVGTLIGLSGGQNSGGAHPVDRMWSTGPHLHTGWFAKYQQTAIGSRPYGPDFTPYLQQLRGGKFPSPQGQIDVTGNVSASLNTGNVPNIASDIGNVVSSFFGIFGFGTPSYTMTGDTLLNQVHQTLVSHPGFYGIALAIDEAEQFPGYENVATGPFDIPGNIRSVALTIGDNVLPTAIRGGLVGLGGLILVLLLLKIVLGIGEKVAPVAAAFL